MKRKNSDTIAKIEDYVQKYSEEHLSSPTIREIAEGTGLTKSTVSNYVTFMQEQGILGGNGGHRSIISRTELMTRQESIRVPVLGSVSCGVPKLAAENIEEYVRLPVTLFGRGDYFILRANGDSMINAGIDHGDFVLVHQQSYADPGQIVVALVDDEEATLKRFYPDFENGIDRLHPENPTMEDILVENCVIQGVAIKVLKELR